MEQDADDAFELVMRSRANANSANDREERDSRYDREEPESSAGHGASWSLDWHSERNDWQDAATNIATDSLPHGWEAMKSRSTGQTYYFNTYTQESQYDVPTEPAHDNRHMQVEDSRSKYHDSGSAGAQRSHRNHPRDSDDAWEAWGSKPAYDPKSFLDFDAKACNLQSSRELFLQQQKLRGDQNSKKDKKKRSRSRKKKRKRSSSSSSSSSSSRGKKRKKGAVQAKEKEDEDRVNRIRKAREMRRQSAKAAPEKIIDGGTIDLG